MKFHFRANETKTKRKEKLFVHDPNSYPSLISSSIFHSCIPPRWGCGHIVSRLESYVALLDG